jgi:hypothetical protein
VGVRIRAAMLALGWMVTAWMGPGSAARAAEPSDSEVARDDEIADLRRKLDTVVGELETLRAQIGAPATAEERELESVYGLGPGASKIYSLSRGLSVGGYAEAAFRQCCSDVDGGGESVWDMTRVVAYLGYKFTDRIVFNTEIEFEHGSTSNDGSVSVEFATLDFLLADEINARMGLLLLPMGFVNEVHEPPFYFGTNRPQVERVIIPSTWRENGAGIFGRFGERLSYRLYVVNGFDATGFSSAGLRGGRQNGSEALAEDLAVVGRVDLDVLDGLRFGGSYYLGGAGQNQSVDVGGTDVELPNTQASIWELHAEYRWRALTARALFARAHLSDTGQLSELFTAADQSNPVISSVQYGGYGEIAYDLMPLFFPGSEMSLEPFFRFEYVDTQANVPSGFSANRAFIQRIYTPGLQFKPIPNVVLKLDYRNVNAFSGTVGDEVSFGFGLVF